MLLEIIVRGAKHDNKTEAPAEFIRQFEKNKDSLVRELLGNLGDF